MHTPCGELESRAVKYRAHACDRVGLGIREPELHPWGDDGGALIELVTDPNSIRTVRNEWSGGWAGVSA
jgi:hypothetical protein